MAMKAGAAGLACRAGTATGRVGKLCKRGRGGDGRHKGGPAEERAYSAGTGILIVYKFKF